MMTAGKKCVIDGIRNYSTYEELCGLLGQALPIIYVQATPDDALRFYRSREEPSMNEAGFAAILAHPTESGVPEFAKRAGMVLYNHGDKESHLGVARTAMRRWLL